MRALNYRYIDPFAEIIETLHRGYCDLLAASSQSWNVRISPPGLLLWADGDHVKTIYDFVIKQAMTQGAPGSKIALTVIERGNMDECSVWCSRWALDADLLEYPPGDMDAGAGMSMRICRGVVEMHGGHMWIESAPGSWARVIFVLPKRNTSRP